MNSQFKRLGLVFSALTLSITPVISLQCVSAAPNKASRKEVPVQKQRLASSEQSSGKDYSNQQLLHLLNRVSFGPAPGDLEKLKSEGVDAYINEQLHPQTIKLPDNVTKLSQVAALQDTPAKLFLTYGRPALKAIAEKGRSDKDEDKKAVQKALHDNYFKLYEETANARLGRAVESPAQLQEVMTDFWYNHFNISVEKNLDHLWVGSFEEQAIRPYALGKFRNLLGATAHHAAMMFYLDNWQNTAPHSKTGEAANAAPDKNKNAAKFKGLNENYARELMELHTLGVDGGYSQKDVQELARVLTGLGLPPGAGGGFGQRNKNQRLAMMQQQFGQRRFGAGHGQFGAGQGQLGARQGQFGAGQGQLRGQGQFAGGALNGGRGARQGQFPSRPFISGPDAANENMQNEEQNMMMQGNFSAALPPAVLNNPLGSYFDESRHDFGEKLVVGHKIEGKGEAEIEEVLDILAKHPSTAHHISYQLAQYFVSDTPPASLVDRLSQKFLQTDGDIAEVMNTLLHSQEFWDAKAVNSKFKSPYRYLISSLRATDAQIQNLQPSTGLLAQLGMPLYKCLTPDGYKNTKEAWLNPDNLINRLNFATAYGAGRFPGVRPSLEDPSKLADCIGPALSDRTLDAVMKSPEKLRTALLLGSPEFMKY